MHSLCIHMSSNNRHVFLNMILKQTWIFSTVLQIDFVTLSVHIDTLERDIPCKSHTKKEPLARYLTVTST